MRKFKILNKSLTSLVIVLVLSLSLSYTFIFPDNKTDDFINEISKSVRKGDYKELAKYFNQTLDMTLPGNEGTYSKSQAEMIVKDFFSKYKPLSFSVKSTGDAKPGFQFIIGELATDKGVFRSYFLIKKSSDSYSIQQLKFEK